MCDDWVITPPSSPVFGIGVADQGFSRSKHEIIIKRDCTIRLFCCMGEPTANNVIYHPEGYLSSNEIALFKEDYTKRAIYNDDTCNSLRLFDFTFDRGSALLHEMDSLFKMARKCLNQLDSAAKMSMKAIGKIQNDKNVNYMKLRRHIVEFLICVRDYMQRALYCNKYAWVINELLPDLLRNLNNFRLMLGKIEDMPNYTLNYSANSNGNKCCQPSYHFYHCQLDVRWLHLTLVYQLTCNNYFKSANTSMIYSQSHSESQNMFEKYILLAISDLIMLALKRFEQVKQVSKSNHLLNKTPFSCTCVREFWCLLIVSTDYSYSKGRCQSFWEYFNRISNRVLNEEDNFSSIGSKTDCSQIILPESYQCSNKPAFILWLLKHLSALYVYRDPDGDQEILSNYPLLESVIKVFITNEIPEDDLRDYLVLIEKTLNIGWEMKSEPVLIFWEYFHKKLNNPFYLSRASSVSGMEVIGKSALALLVQANSRISEEKSESNTDSFNLFLRLIGITLQKWKENPRFWNQLKGRIFTKFSSSKMLTLNEIGLHRFVSLFLTLAITTDLEEVSNRFQYFMKLLPLENLDQPKLELVVKSQMAFVILHAERNKDISVISTVVLDMVDSASLQKDRFCLISIFIEAFQDLIDCTDNLELGQYMYIGRWITHSLVTHGESVNSRILDAVMSVINKLKRRLYDCCLLSEDSQLILLHEALWEHVIPNLKKQSMNNSNACQIAEIMSALTSSAFLPITQMKRQAIDLFDYLITSVSTDSTLLCRYLSEICSRVDINRLFGNKHISLIKGWLRCCIMLTDEETNDSELRKITKCIMQLPEIKELLAEQTQDISKNNGYFKNFLKALALKYSQLQDGQSKNKLRSVTCCYFSSIEKSLQYLIKIPKSVGHILQIYKSISLLFTEIPHLIYGKSMPNTVLQCLLDTMLLPMSIRSAEYKQHPYISNSIWNTVDGFVIGLIKLGPSNDLYIARSVRDIITIYVPRLMASKGTIQASLNNKFSLIRCFKDEEQNEDDKTVNKLILETIGSDSFFKRKAKIPHQHTSSALTFVSELVKYHRYSRCVIGHVVRIMLDRICDIIMYCECDNVCKRQAKELLKLILDIHLLYPDRNIRNDFMTVLSKLCYEHLAFSAKLLFDLLENVAKLAPDLVTQFLPELNAKVKEVENKRGVGFDRSLRKGIERIETAVKST